MWMEGGKGNEDGGREGRGMRKEGGKGNEDGGREGE